MVRPSPVGDGERSRWSALGVEHLGDEPRFPVANKAPRGGLNVPAPWLNKRNRDDMVDDVSLLVIAIPGLVLAALGVTAAIASGVPWKRQRTEWVLATTMGAVSWGAYLLLVPHKIDSVGCRGRCMTVFGSPAPLAAENTMALLALLSALACSAYLLAQGARLPPQSIGLATVIVPLSSAWPGLGPWHREVTRTVCGS